MNTPFVQIHIALEHPGAKLPPQTLFAIRQLFPAAFRRATGCLTGDNGCNGGPFCPCRSVFEQKLTADPSALRRYQKPPLPFAFKIPLLPEKPVKGFAAELTLVIAGGAISHLELFLAALGLLFASPGPLHGWKPVGIQAASEDGGRIAIPAGGEGARFDSLPLISFDEFFNLGCAPCSRITINFLTPLRLLHKGVPLREIEFSALAGGLFRRVSSMAFYYGNEELPHDFKWLAERSRTIGRCSADLRWVNRGGGLQGIEGCTTFCGELTDFIPFLQLGSRLNIGKGAAYGMGSYSLAVD